MSGPAKPLFPALCLGCHRDPAHLPYHDPLGCALTHDPRNSYRPPIGRATPSIDHKHAAGAWIESLAPEGDLFSCAGALGPDGDLTACGGLVIR